MSMKIKKQRPAPKAETQTKEKPGLWRRGGAYMLDWFIGDLFASFPVTIMYAMIYDTTELNNDLSAFPPGEGIMAGVLAVLCSLVYFVFLPWRVWPGQTVGKKICGLRIVSAQGGPAGLKEMLLRQVAGIFVIEGCLVTASLYLRQLAFVITGAEWVLKYPFYMGMGFALISAVLILLGPSGRGLHDYLAGTKVESAD